MGLLQMIFFRIIPTGVNSNFFQEFQETFLQELWNILEGVQNNKQINPEKILDGSSEISFEDLSGASPVVFCGFFLIMTSGIPPDVYPWILKECLSQIFQNFPACSFWNIIRNFCCDSGSHECLVRSSRSSSWNSSKNSYFDPSISSFEDFFLRSF